MPDPQQRDHAPPRAGGSQGRAFRLIPASAAGRRVLFALLAAAVMAVTFWMSGQAATGPRKKIPLPRGPLGNVMHVATFACLGYLLARAFDADGASAGLGSRAGRSALAVAAVFAVTDEAHQFFAPGRVSSLYDAFLDVAGAAVALLWPRLAGTGRPRSFAPALACLALAVTVALVTGWWRPPGDDAIERALIRLGAERD